LSAKFVGESWKLTKGKSRSTALLLLIRHRASVLALELTLLLAAHVNAHACV
jgi:hypothetical protein